MKVLKFSLFLENKESDILPFYAFDWDDNILIMPTVIHMEKKSGTEWIPVDVTTSKFAEIRNDENYRMLNNNINDTFGEFRDTGKRGDKSFVLDIEKAINYGSFGPSWNDFVECLTNGSAFAIITARGHESPTLRKGVEWIIDNVLTEEQLYEMFNNLVKYYHIFGKTDDFERILKGRPSENKLIKEYLDICEFVAVSAPSRSGSALTPEEDKKKVLLDFKKKINDFAKSVNRKATIGFSDDDVKTVKHMEDLVDSIDNEEFPNIVKYIIKGTKYPENITKKVRVVEEASHQSPGLESSVMPFRQFNNMKDRMFTNSDEYDKSIGLGSDQLAKMSKEYVKNNSRKKRKKRTLKK